MSTVEDKVSAEMAEGGGPGMPRPSTPTGRTLPARVVLIPGSPEQAIERMIGHCMMPPYRS